MMALYSSLVVVAVTCAAVCCARKGGDVKSDCPVTSEQVEEMFKECRHVVKSRRTLEVKLAKQGKVIKADQKFADLSLNRQSNLDPGNREKELKQLPFLSVTTKLIQTCNLTQEQATRCLPKVKLAGKHTDVANGKCLQGIGLQCDRRAKFRTADGTCNNLENPRWGSAGACFRRMLEPRYVGESGFRRSVVDGAELPEPRTLSLRVHSHLDVPTHDFNHMYMFYGQLLDHDITQAPSSTTGDNQAIQCCGGQGELHPQCAPIAVHADDPFYAQFATTCINFVRSAPCPTCSLGPRIQMNQRTTFIDASFQYGNSVNETVSLRENDGTGRMRVERSPFGDLMPSTPDPANDRCSFVNTSDICFLAGDFRVNQHIVVASLHIVLLREHNRLAEGLRRLNPKWGGERIFQEARKIVGAEMQVITYKEYLPITLGSDRMTEYGLWLGDTTPYDRQTDPTLFSEFSGAAFRFGHSLVNGPIGGHERTRLLRDAFFQPFALRLGVLSKVMSGVTTSPAQCFDRHLVRDITDFLFRRRGQPAGLDLAAINIQRGRDHGLPCYVDLVRHCAAVTVKDFEDLVTHGIMPEENRKILEQNYRSVLDVDLWTGILSETKEPGAAVGVTGACIIGTQFRNLKDGDRFYFEHRDQPGSFTDRQLQELRKITLSKLICRNTDVKNMPKNGMLFNSKTNPFVTCSSIVDMDLTCWKE